MPAADNFPNGVAIREATMDDATGITYVQATTWISQYPNPAYDITENDIRAIDWHGKVPQCQHMIKSTEYTVWVAADGKDVYGFAVLVFYQDTSELYALNVLPEYQNRGIGSLLLRTVLEGANGDILLHVAVYNQDAQRLYHRYGFVETGARGVFTLPGGKTIPTIHMRREYSGGNSQIPTYVFRSELAKRSGVRESTIKWYTEMGLLPYTQQDAKRRRRYPVDAVIKRLELIARLRNEGYSLEAIRRDLA